MPTRFQDNESERIARTCLTIKLSGQVWTRNLYLAFEILDYASFRTGSALKKALVDAGIGRDIIGSYDNGIYQPVFSIVAKNANVEQKEALLPLLKIH